jgi:hypothetical protein
MRVAVNHHLFFSDYPEDWDIDRGALQVTTQCRNWVTQLFAHYKKLGWWIENFECYLNNFGD